jgi:hypothetical protein
MKFKLSLFVSLLFSVVSFSQQPEQEAEIVKEGITLYKSEMASWYGSDLFAAKVADTRANAGGYFSYTDGARTKCIFFSKDEPLRVLAAFSFDSTFSTSTAVIEAQERKFTEKESELYTIRSSALSIIRTDTLFKSYRNATLNLVPIADEGGKRVYVLTGPQNNGVVLFGNDYLITFDQQNNIAAKSKLHKGLIPIEYGSKDGATVFGSMHTHLPGYSPHITATDICTLMLYEKFAKWKQHYVMSNRFVSIWNCDTDKLTTLTREAWDKINSDQMKKKN